jgi:putative tricarboxylic transport membrane protein
MNQNNINNKSAEGNNVGSLIVSVFFVLAGFLTLYDTRSYSDADSSVFPQAAAILLILCATVSTIQNLIRPIADEGFGRGSWWRRLLLVTTMLLSCFVMSYIGFLLAAAIAFVGGMIAAMHDQWCLKNSIVYLGSGVLIMVVFYMLFRYVLYVPLP